MIEASSIRLQCDLHKEEQTLTSYLIKDKRLACLKCVKKAPPDSPIIDVNDVMLRANCTSLVTQLQKLMREVMACMDELNKYLFVPEDPAMRVISAQSLMSNVMKAYELLKDSYRTKEEREALFFSEENYVK